MKNSLGFVIFIAGAAIGSAATWYYTKKKYERIAQEEIVSVKEKFSAKKEPTTINNVIHTDSAEKKAAVAKEKPSIAEYAKQLSKEGYTNYSNVETPEDYKKDPDVTEIPFVIPPEEFGELEDEGYFKVSLTYYADGVLADEDDEIVEDVDSWVGKESLDHFGEYEDDSVFVRNHRLKTDYEILLSQREYYTDVLEEKPYLRRYDE